MVLCKLVLKEILSIFINVNSDGGDQGPVHVLSIVLLAILLILISQNVGAYLLETEDFSVDLLN